MQTNVEKLTGLKRKLSVVLPAEEFTKKRKAVLAKQAQKAKIDGFRPGKAPLNVIEQHYGQAIVEQVIDDLVNASLQKVFIEQKILPVNRPALEAMKGGNDKDPFEFTVTFEVAPEIDTIHFDHVTVNKTVSQVSAKDIDHVLENMTKQFGQYETVARAAAVGDRTDIDFAGSIDGVPFDGGTAAHYPVVLGQGQMIPGFEDGITGMKAGDEKTITVTFPENYHKDLAGKTAEFKITLHKVEALKPAAIDEALVKRLGVASGDLAELKKEVEKTLTRELNHKLRQELHETVFTKLRELNPIELPETVVHQEVHHLMNEAKERFKKMTGQKEAPDFPHDMFEAQAKARVQNSYLLMKVIEANQLKADTAAVNKLAEDMAASYENPEQVRDFYLSNEEHRNNLQNLALEDVVVDFLLAKATVQPVEKTYAVVMEKKDDHE